MPREQSFFLDYFSRLDYLRQLQRQMTLYLGGSSGSGGGGGSPPGGFQGMLPQTRVTGDTTESFDVTSGSQINLVSNLDNIRGWLKPAHYFWADTTDPVSDQLQIAMGVWFHADGQPPLDFDVTNTPSIVAPSTNPRIALLTVDTAGNLDWAYGTESATPVEPDIPSATSGTMPLWAVYERTTGTTITRYDDSANHYIYADRRPIWDWGIGGAGGGGVLDTSSPQDVGVTAVVGTSGSSSHGDHVHRGVHSVSIPSGSFAYNDIVLQPGTNILLEQSSGSFTINNTLGAGGIEFDPTNPFDVGVAADTGSSGSAPHADHVHRGVHGIFVAPNTSIFGSIELTGSGGVTVTQSSGSFDISSSGGGMDDMQAIAYAIGLGG